MFKVSAAPEFTHTVPIAVPVDGGHEEQTLSARYRVLDDDQVEAFRIDTPEGLKNFLRSVIVELGDLVDSEKNPVAYNHAVRDQLIGLPYVRLGLLRGYLGAVTKARLGN